MKSMDSLRVAPKLDSGDYERGARQMDAASKSVATALKEVDVQLGNVGLKASRTRSQTELLSREFIDGYGEAARLSAKLQNLSHEMEVNGLSAERAALIYRGMVREYGMIANAATIAATAHVKLAPIVNAVNAEMRLEEVQARSTARALDTLANARVAANQNIAGVGANFRRQNLGYQIFDIGQTAAMGMNPAMVLAQQGPQIIQIYGGNGGVNALLKDMAVLAGGAARAVWPIGLAAGAGALAIQSMREEIERATGSSVTFGRTTSTVLGLIADDVKSVLQPAFDAIGPSASYALDQLGSAAVDIAELIINSFRAAFEDIKFAWNAFPDLIGAAMTGAANRFIDGVNVMTSTTAAGIDQLIVKLNEITGSNYSTIGDRLQLPHIPNDSLDRLQRDTDDRNKRIEDIMSSNPIRDWFKSLTDRAAEVLRYNLPENGPVPGVNPRHDLSLDPFEAGVKAFQSAVDKFNQGVSTLNSDLIFEREQLFRSPMDQEIASRLRPTGLDLDSPQARFMRETMVLQENKDALMGFWQDFRSSVRQNGGNIGQALADAITNAMTKRLDKMMDRAMDSLFSALLGSGSTGPGVIERLVGRLPSNDNFSPTTTLGGLLGHAPAATMPVGGSGDTLAWSFWKSKGLADHQVAGILGNIKAESAFNPLAVGDGGNAFGLYQHNDRRFNLFNAIGGKANLSDELAQHRFAYSELMGPENRAWKALVASQDVRGATAAFAGFERPSGFSWGNPEAAHNFIGRLNGANEALAKFGGTAGSATNTLGTFGSGLDKFGSALSSVNLGGGAGGGFNWASLFSGFTPNTTLGSFLTGGFADGAEWTRGGLAMVGERGREIVRLPRGSQVISNHRTESLAAAARNDGPQAGIISQTIINNTGQPVHTEERPDARGGRRQIVTIGSVVAEAMGTPGSPLARQMERQFGVKRRMNNIGQ